ncbi:helix-turn-helix domain-containing protein [Actinotalea sp.]|uniref:helix-turn-helix domain-containing protein n=1 Tax=Actinotalea sp. TaxID=1872145 RepID=UPI0035681361
MCDTDDRYTEYEKRVIGALRMVREVSGVDQVPLSLAAGMGRNQVNRYERLKVHATLGNLERLLVEIGQLAERRTNVRTVYDLLSLAEGKIALTVEQSSE